MTVQEVSWSSWKEEGEATTGFTSNVPFGVDGTKEEVDVRDVWSLNAVFGWVDERMGVGCSLDRVDWDRAFRVFLFDPPPREDKKEGGLVIPGDKRLDGGAIEG